MVQLVRELVQLRQLTSYLKKFHPSSLHVLGQIVSKVTGRVDGQVFVNHFPNPSVVMVQPKQIQSMNMQECALFANNSPDLKQFLTETTLFNWSQPLQFTSLNKQYEALVLHAGSCQGGTMSSTPDHFMFYSRLHTSQDKLEPNLPNGLEITRLKEEDAYVVAKHWKHSSPGSEEQDKFIISKFPNVGIREKNTKRLVAWLMMYYDLSLAKGHVLPEYRNRGILKCMLNEMYSRVPQTGSEYMFSYVAVNNTVSLSINKAYFESQYEGRFVWTKYEPCK